MMNFDHIPPRYRKELGEYCAWMALGALTILAIAAAAAAIGNRWRAAEAAEIHAAPHAAPVVQQESATNP